MNIDNIDELKLKIDKLRLKYKDAKTESDRKIIAIQGKMLKIVFERYYKRHPQSRLDGA